jgi:hypothetical protein
MADGGKCFWCGIPLYYRDVQIEHVIPEFLENRPVELQKVRVNYGLGDDFQLNAFGNWVTCHQGCNLRKGAEMLPLSPATLFVLSQLRQRGPKLDRFKRAFLRNLRRERILATLRSALEEGSIEVADIEELTMGLPVLPVASAVENPTIHLSKTWDVIVPTSPAAVAAAQGWRVTHASGNIAYVHNERFGGVMPNVSNPHPSWQCSNCGSYGPWNGIVCGNCGNREEPE